MADSTTWAIAVSIASPIIAAASALVATWMTNTRHDRRAAIDADQARRRVDRELIVGVLLPAREWARMMEVLLPAFWKMTDNDLTEFVDTDTGRRQRDIVEQRDVALTRARLFLSNQRLSEIVGKVTTFVGRFPEVVMDPIHRDKGNIGWSARDWRRSTRSASSSTHLSPKRSRSFASQPDPSAEVEG